jgi:hypothetical protein
VASILLLHSIVVIIIIIIIIIIVVVVVVVVVVSVHLSVHGTAYRLTIDSRSGCCEFDN